MFVFKQKSAYDMRISDWSSYVCSSDLSSRGDADGRRPRTSGKEYAFPCGDAPGAMGGHPYRGGGDRKSVVSGTRVSARVDLGGRRSIKNKWPTSYVSTTML